MEQSQTVISNLFSTFTSTITGGLLPDLQTVIIGVAGLLLILVAFDILMKVMFGRAASTALSDWWQESGDYEHYRKYKNDKERKEWMNAVYETQRYNKENPKHKLSLPKRRDFRL